MRYGRSWGRLGMIYKLIDIMDLIGGGTPKTSREEYWNGDIPWISVKDFNNNLRYVYKTEKSITKKGLENSSAKLLHKGDMIISARGTVGEIASIPFDMSFNQSCYGLRARKNIVTNDFLYYLIKYKISDLKRQSHGSVFDTITRDTFRGIEVNIPCIENQYKIANILSKLDYKIELNNQINRNLSEQMQAIFGSIFYSEMEKGNKASLGDYLYIKGRIGWKGLKKEEYLSESEYRIINGESLTVTGIDWNKAGYISDERYIESPEIMLQEGDILISKDGTIGKIGYVNKLDKPTSVASGIFVVRNLKPEEVSTVFIYCLLNSDYFKSFIASRTEGSVIPHLYQKDFVTLEIPILSQEQIELFNSTVVPLFELFFLNQTENIRLAALRDSLLPKLMSGELDVLDLDI